MGPGVDLPIYMYHKNTSNVGKQTLHGYPSIYFFVGHMESPKNQTLFPTSLCPPSHLLSTTNQVYGRHMCFRLHTLNLQKCPWWLVTNASQKDGLQMESKQNTLPKTNSSRPWKRPGSKRSKSSPKPVLLNDCVSFKEFIPRKNKGIQGNLKIKIVKLYIYIWYFYIFLSTSGWLCHGNLSYTNPIKPIPAAAHTHTHKLTR